MNRAVVYREHTLGVMMTSDRPKYNIMQVLNRSVLKGAPFLQDDWFYVSEKDIRPATRDDFDTYQVMYHPDYLVK